MTFKKVYCHYPTLLCSFVQFVCIDVGMEACSRVLTALGLLTKVNFLFDYLFTVLLASSSILELRMMYGTHHHVTYI